MDFCKHKTILFILNNRINKPILTGMHQRHPNLFPFNFYNCMTGTIYSVLYTKKNFLKKNPV